MIDLEPLKEMLAVRKYEEGIDYVNSRYLSTRMTFSTKQIGPAMSELEDRGIVERFGRSRGITWKILDVEELPDPSGGSDKSLETEETQ